MGEKRGVLGKSVSCKEKVKTLGKNNHPLTATPAREVVPRRHRVLGLVRSEPGVARSA